jgi:general stress protein 26
MNDTQHFAKLIKNIKFAMLNTLDANGQISSRPMTVLDFEFDGDLWFFAGKSANFISHIENVGEVNLTFSENHSFLSANGHAAVVDDETKKRELWRPAYKAWFPLGIDDPELVLIKVNVQSADYWEAPSLKVVRLLGFAKAVLTGKQSDLGKHGHLN